MSVILGYDAAWTERNNGGVAVVRGSEGNWRLESCDIVNPGVSAGVLVRKMEQRCGSAIDLICVDMPLSHSEIVARREADDAISREYGGRHCSTHSPNPDRPGKRSSLMRDDLARRGFNLCTEVIVTPGLIEVYPHPALLHLMGRASRVPYKAQKMRSYWKELDPHERRMRLIAEWEQLVDCLETEIKGAATLLAQVDSAMPVNQLKAVEDRIDAVVCAWVGICALQGRVRPFGDRSAAIWVPDF